MVSVASNERDLDVQYSKNSSEVAVLKYQNNHHWASSKSSAQRYSLPPSKNHQPSSAVVSSKLPPHGRLLNLPKNSRHHQIPLPFSKDRPPSASGSHHFRGESIGNSVATNTFSSFLSSSGVASNEDFISSGTSNAARIFKGSAQGELRYRPMSLVKPIETKATTDLNHVAITTQKPRSKSLVSLPNKGTSNNRESSVPSVNKLAHRLRMPNPNPNSHPVSSIPNEKSRVVLDKSFAILKTK